MNAISIQQPWADLIVSGVKDIENRNWSTEFRGNILIHAGRQFDEAGLNHIQLQHGILIGKTSKDFVFGGVVGMTTITDCVEMHSSKWFFGKYGFVCEHSCKMQFIPCLGKLGIFECEEYEKWINTAPAGFDEHEFFERAAILEYDGKFSRLNSYRLAKIELQLLIEKRSASKRNERLSNYSVKV